MPTVNNNKNMINIKKVEQLLITILSEKSRLDQREKEERSIRQGYNIGRILAKREGHMVMDVWEDGQLIKDIQRKLLSLEQEKEIIQQAKKELLNTKRRQLKQNKQEDDEQFKKPFEKSIFKYQEQEEIYKLRLNLIKKEINDIKQEELQYEVKKEVIRFQRLLANQRNSRFNNNPILNDGRYMLLELLGKGGFSEVYKAFDLYDLKYVACKIHQLDQKME